MNEHGMLSPTMEFRAYGSAKWAGGKFREQNGRVRTVLQGPKSQPTGKFVLDTLKMQ